MMIIAKSSVPSVLIRKLHACVTLARADFYSLPAYLGYPGQLN